MAKRGQHSFVRRQKEIKRKEKAAEKMMLRQGKKDRPDGASDVEEPELDGMGNVGESEGTPADTDGEGEIESPQQQ